MTTKKKRFSLRGRNSGSSTSSKPRGRKLSSVVRGALPARKKKRR